MGMSAVAQAVSFCGCRVSGSDRCYDHGDSLPILTQLRKVGIDLHAQDGRGVRAGAEAVVVSTAIESDNPDLVAARELNLPVLHRSEVLAELVRGKTCLAVAGTSGKSTVTGMVGWILDQAGMEPNVVNGAPVINWQSSNSVGNARVGTSDLWVIEADESDRSLLNYSPQYAVVTNMSADHFSLEETKKLFVEFSKRVRGKTVGALEASPYLQGIDPTVSASRIMFSYGGVDFELSLPGRHNVEDALHAVELCRLVGVTVEQCSAALREFKGIHRRLELVGKAGGVTVIDDYGHNPAKIEAAWNAVAPFSRRGILVWRPHGYGPLRTMLDDLSTTIARMSSANDILLILPVYDAGGTADRTLNSDVLVQRLKGQGLDARFVESHDAALSVIRREARVGDAVIIMGARDPLLPQLGSRAVSLLAS